MGGGAIVNRKSEIGNGRAVFYLLKNFAREFADAVKSQLPTHWHGLRDSNTEQFGATANIEGDSMSGSVNKVILIGRLGRDPEMRSTPSGATVAKFSIATDERYTDRSGAKQERTEWHNIVAWDKLAEICGQYLRKGKLVFIEGRIRTESWDDKETGQKRYRTEIVAREMQMLDRRGDDESGTYATVGASKGQAATATQIAEDDEVPF
jgi:single-strand DNA-binding protein